MSHSGTIRQARRDITGDVTRRRHVIVERCYDVRQRERATENVGEKETRRYVYVTSERRCAERRYMLFWRYRRARCGPGHCRGYIASLIWRVR